MEISSKDGHIVALNISEPVPRGLSSAETVDKIHSMGGVAIACHPYALFKGSLGKNVSARFDAVEVVNARAFPFNRSVRKAKEFAESLKLTPVAGTDAHFGPQIGYGYTEITSEPNVEAIVKSIKEGLCKPFGKPVPFKLNLQLQIQRMARMRREQKQAQILG